MFGIRCLCKHTLLSNLNNEKCFSFSLNIDPFLLHPCRNSLMPSAWPRIRIAYDSVLDSNRMVDAVYSPTFDTI